MHFIIRRSNCFSIIKSLLSKPIIIIIPCFHFQSDFLVFLFLPPFYSSTSPLIIILENKFTFIAFNKLNMSKKYVFEFNSWLVLESIDWAFTCRYFCCCNSYNYISSGQRRAQDFFFSMGRFHFFKVGGGGGQKCAQRVQKTFYRT